MTEQEIIEILAHWVDNNKHPFQLSNVFIYAWESDYWAMTQGGETREFEIKISRSDYFNDAKKAKHKSETGANYFYYVVPRDLIQITEVEQRYGLIYVWFEQMGEIKSPRLQIMRKPRRLNNNSFDLWKQLATKMYWRYRELWKEKWLKKEITRSEYVQGFNIELENALLNELL